MCHVRSDPEEGRLEVAMNEQMFLAALHADSDDDVTWLALADWLDDDGQADRAELLRLVRRLRSVDRPGERAALEARVTALLNAGVRPVVPVAVNRIGMRLALIPPGKFLMGWPSPSDDATLVAFPQHEVEITRAFYLGVYQVTQAQWRPGPHLPSGVVQPEWLRSARHARQCLGVVQRLVHRGGLPVRSAGAAGRLGPRGPGRQLVQLRPLLPLGDAREVSA
jgi:uncharacterized protein (TIGR02996 family)